ncbi:DUF2380 domain-containing protein [Bradyrhizobium sp. WD16]|uniref:DUF2380 domain-containing protein n=1 Tax=Bradyrhizobium sp. WD16 TaxID=1521768 RepID=UPI0020A5562A|nr:DUF2380 domain-containing protein [Bradyrhizobium sp. WD16]UTD29362.1 hypothetical protein DB459_23060 [Bradyrhizobium sp. WD16]
MRNLLLRSVALGLLLAPCCGSADDKVAHNAVIAVVDFDYTDGSGEMRDQSQEHAARLAAFMTALRNDLSARANLRVVAPSCSPEPCAPAGPRDDLLAAARAAGASIVLVGGVHKTSTLVQWANVEAIDAATGRILFHKLFSFRGDNDEAWRRAESFIAGEIVALPPS